MTLWSGIVTHLRAEFSAWIGDRAAQDAALYFVAAVAVCVVFA
jgi:hypothetical protein